MDNIDMKMEGKILVIRVDTTKELGPSKSGKSILIASTKGNATVPGSDIKVGFNAFR